MRVNCCLTLEQDTIALLDATAKTLQLPRSHVVEEILLDQLAGGDLAAKVEQLARRLASKIAARLLHRQPDPRNTRKERTNAG